MLSPILEAFNTFTLQRVRLSDLFHGLSSQIQTVSNLGISLEMAGEPVFYDYV